MRTTFAGIVSTAVLFVAALGLTSSAQAQATAVQVKVPFAFEEGTRLLPAGVYKLREDGRMLAIHGPSGSAIMLVAPEVDNAPSQTSKVVFHRYGDRYFLREVWIEGSKTHVASLPSRSERRMQVASVNTQPTGDMVALLGSSH